MRGFGSLFACLFVVALIIKFIWWILGAIAIVALFYLVRAIVRAHRAARLAHEKRCAEVASRAEQQHRWVLEGDDRGIYGQYPVPDIVKKELYR